MNGVTTHKIVLDPLLLFLCGRGRAYWYLLEYLSRVSVYHRHMQLFRHFDGLVGLANARRSQYDNQRFHAFMRLYAKGGYRKTGLSPEDTSLRVFYEPHNIVEILVFTHFLYLLYGFRTQSFGVEQTVGFMYAVYAFVGEIVPSQPDKV